ncbi:MAG: energy coupling factor transporter S component ThiW [Promethearchaeota archaeon]
MNQVRNVDKKTNKLTLKIAMVAIFTALGVVLSYLNPFAYISIFGSKPDPFAHLINGIAGVLLGPFYAPLIAFFIALIRNMTSIGTPLAFPGGIPGAFVVGFATYLLKKKNIKYTKFGAFFEPLGTVFIGGTISNYIIPLGPFYSWWGIFAVSCVPGAILGFIVLLILEKQNITYLNFE